MKTINWERGIQGAISNHPPKNGKMLMPNDPVETGMHVTAKYKGLDIHLRIKEEVKAGTFKAEVLFFEPVLAQKPDDLSQGDEVVIGREFICWLYTKE